MVMEQDSPWVTAAMAGVGGTPEWRALVRAALLEREEAARNALTADLPPEDRDAQLAQVLGPPEDATAEVTASLQGTHQRQQRIRNVFRWLIPITFLLCSVILALIFIRLIGTTAAINGMSSGFEQPDAKTIYPFPWQRHQRERLAFLLYGDESRESHAAQLRAIWESEPENRVYYALYTNALIAEAWGNAAQTAHIEQELRRGIKLEPDNAMYHYALAATLAYQAVEKFGDSIKKSPDGKRFIYPYKIRNRALLDRAMTEMRAGLFCRTCTGHYADMVNAQIAALPPGKSFEGQVMRITVGSSILLPMLAKYRALARFAPYYAQVLIDEGRREEALFWLEGWHQYVRQIAEGSDTLIGVLVANALVRIWNDPAVAIYNELRMPSHAERNAALAKRVKAAFDQFNTKRMQWKKQNDQFIKRHGGIMSSILLPDGTINSSIAKIMTADIAPSRRVELSFFARLQLLVTISWFGFLFFYIMIVTRRRQLRRQRESQPLLLILTRQEWLRVMILGLVLPIILLGVCYAWVDRQGVYAVVTQFTTEFPGSSELLSQGTSADEVLPTSLPATVLILVLGLFAAISLLLLPGYFARRYLRRRCQALRIPVPSPARDVGMRILGALGIVGLIITMLTIKQLPDMIPELWNYESFAGLQPLAFLLLFTPMLWEHRQYYGTYYGTLARSLLPVYAVSMLLLMGILYPALSAYEYQQIRRDTVIYSLKPFRYGFTPAEDAVVQHLRDGFLAGCENR